jgi:hypothetical protein
LAGISEIFQPKIFGVVGLYRFGGF